MAVLALYIVIIRDEAFAYAELWNVTRFAATVRDLISLLASHGFYTTIQKLPLTITKGRSTRISVRIYSVNVRNGVNTCILSFKTFYTIRTYIEAEMPCAIQTLSSFPRLQYKKSQPLIDIASPQAETTN
jgi:hypothetical protein